MRAEKGLDDRRQLSIGRRRLRSTNRKMPVACVGHGTTFVFVQITSLTYYSTQHFGAGVTVDA